MTSPHTTALDNALAEVGENVILRRGVSDDVTVRAVARAFRPEELVGGISQSDSLVIISPTQISVAGWPNNQVAGTPPFDGPTWLPKNNDKMIIQGRLRNVTFVKPISVGGEIVRIELTVSG